MRIYLDLQSCFAYNRQQMNDSNTNQTKNMKNTELPTVPRQIPNPEGSKTYATEASAERAATSIPVDARFMIIPAFNRKGISRFRVVFIISDTDQISYLLGSGHQIIA